MHTHPASQIGLSFAMTSEQRMGQGLAHDFSRREMAHVADRDDHAAEFPTPVIPQARQAELLNINIARELLR